MQLKIEAVGQQKTSTYGPYFGIKAGGVWYNVQGDRQDWRGKTIEVTVKHSGKFKWPKIVKEITASEPTDTDTNTNGKHKLNQFVMAEALDFWWDKVKALELADEAKASVLCSLLIGTSQGNIHYELPDEVPPPYDSDMPF
jgi:hypothetical protein